MYVTILLSVKLFDNKNHERININLHYDSDNNVKNIKSEIIAKLFEQLVKEGISI